jgi:hypothetical protein
MPVGTPFSYVRTGLFALCAVMLFPLLLLAFAPLLLILTPVAFVALPFMLVSFCGGAGDTHMETRRIDSWRVRAATLALAKAAKA